MIENDIARLIAGILFGYLVAEILFYINMRIDGVTLSSAIKSTLLALVISTTILVGIFLFAWIVTPS